MSGGAIFSEDAGHKSVIMSGAPGVNDDVNAGFEPNDKWLDDSVDPREVYVNLKNDAGAAVWEKTTTGGEPPAAHTHVQVDITDLDSVGDLITVKVGAPGPTDVSPPHAIGDHIQDSTTGIIYAAEKVLFPAIWVPITTATSILETTGPTRLTVGAVTDGEFLKRSGATLVSAVPPVTAHAASHTDGSDDVQDATGGQKGLATATQITKLDGIEAAATADQTDAEIETAYNTQVTIVPQAEAEAGTATTRRGWTAERVKQAIEALSTNEDVFTWSLTGPLDTGVNQDGLRAARKSGTIVGVIASARQRGGAGSGGSSLFDINKHVPAKPITTQRNNTAAVTIYTTQANRPDIAGNAANTQNAVKQAPAPDVTTFLAGDFFTMDVDDDGDTGGNSPMDIVVEVFVRYNAT